jgi:CRISPR-associated protein Csx10
LPEYKIWVKALSPMLLASGEGWGPVIDTDITYENWGIPIFPARRLKGLLRESAVEVLEMAELSGLAFGLDYKQDIDKIFGTGQNQGVFCFEDLKINGYKDVLEWVEWAENSFPELITPEAILTALTITRQQTAINEQGTTQEHSLRTVRVLKAGQEFEGEVSILTGSGAAVKILSLACQNLCWVGSKRNRGYGKVDCALLCDGQPVIREILHGLEGGGQECIK